MHPSFGVPWPRLQRAATRLEQLHATQPEPHRVHAVVFLCGLQYLFTYREATGRRLSHYLDDGLREAVEHTLPALMRGMKFRRPSARAGRLTLPQDVKIPFEQLVSAFHGLHQRLPVSMARWLAETESRTNLLRLSFGMGVTARFAPESHEFVRRLVERPFGFRTEVLDVIESFHWHPDWSLALGR